jgi:hypothetical protein
VRNKQYIKSYVWFLGFFLSLRIEALIQHWTCKELYCYMYITEWLKSDQKMKLSTILKRVCFLCMMQEKRIIIKYRVYMQTRAPGCDTKFWSSVSPGFHLSKLGFHLSRAIRLPLMSIPVEWPWPLHKDLEWALSERYCLKGISLFYLICVTNWGRDFNSFRDIKALHVSVGVGETTLYGHDLHTIRCSLTQRTRICMV